MSSTLLTAGRLKHTLSSASLPPTDGTLVIDQLYDWHRVNSGELPCLVWAREDSEKETMSWKELGQGVDRATALIENEFLEVVKVSETSLGNCSAIPNVAELAEPIVVGILSNTDSVTYSTFLLAMERLTHTQIKKSDAKTYPLLPFPLSTRNSPAAIAHLIRTAKVRYVFVSDGLMRNTLDGALGQLAEDDISVTVFKMPTFIDLYSPGSHASTVFDETFPQIPLDTPAVILHSSGSTSFPKSITITHRTLLEIARSLNCGGLSVKGETLAVHGSPLFHAMGLIALAWSPANLVVRAVSSPSLTVLPTPEYFMSQIMVSDATMVFLVPSFLEAWAEDTDSIRVLQTLKAVMFAGAPLSMNAGNFLHSSGVQVHCVFGATEFGIVSATPAESRAEGYEWFEFSAVTAPVFDPQPEDNTFELIFRQTLQHHPAALNTHVDGVPAYATNDLLEQHPMNKNLWRVKGRKDDQIMLSTGEKTNPGPIEEKITTNEHVKAAILFGRGRLQNGVIVEPISWDDFSSAENFRDKIWSSVEEANVCAPSYSRIFKEMILLASPTNPFSYTLKGTARRGQIVKDYAPEIEALYMAVKESSQIDITAPTPSGPDGRWSFDETTNFVRTVVLRVMKGVKSLDNHDDIFEAGCDSLQATYIRNSLLRALRESVPAAQVHKVPSNFVYQHSTIHQLGTYITYASRLEDTANGNIFDQPEEQARAKAMDDIVYKYTRDFPTHKPSLEAVHPAGDVILLTGSTGGLGSQLLAQLVVHPTVSKIYAFNRHGKAGASSRDRQREAFLDRGNDLSILESGKLIFVEGDIGVDGLGIPETLLHEIRDSVTTIIHIAWQVDFKMLFKSFEPAIRGVRNLVDLALHSPRQEPPRLLFASTIGIIRNWVTEKVPEAPVDDPGLIMKTGYSESKWVSERILFSAAAETSLKPVIVRVGQLTGGLNGSWNLHEWFPSLVQGSQALGCVPDNEGMVSWLPLHVAAAALIDLRNASLPVAHLVHPRPVPWTTVENHVAHLLDLPLVPYATWLSKLQVVATQLSEEDTHNNPALRLIDFYVSGTGVGSHLDRKEAMGFPTMEIKKTVQEAPSLRPDRLLQLGHKDVDSWISYWRTKVHR